VFVERLWKSVKYEEVYLRAYETVGEARSSIGRYLDFYNGLRPHSSLDDRTPDQAYFDFSPRGGLTPADAPLIDAELLFRQPEPALGVFVAHATIVRLSVYSDGTVEIIIENIADSSGSVSYDVRAVELVRKEVTGRGRGATGR